MVDDPKPNSLHQETRTLRAETNHHNPGRPVKPLLQARLNPLSGAARTVVQVDPLYPGPSLVQSLEFMNFTRRQARLREAHPPHLAHHQPAQASNRHRAGLEEPPRAEAARALSRGERCENHIESARDCGARTGPRAPRTKDLRVRSHQVD